MPLLRCTSFLFLASFFAGCATDTPTAPAPLAPYASFARFGRSDTAAAAAELRRKLTNRIDRSGFQPAASIEGNVGVMARQRVLLPLNTWGVAVSPSGVALVTHLFDNTVTLLSVATGAKLGTVSVGFIPTSAAFAPGGATAYVANQGGDISVIDIATRTVTASITLPTSPFTVMVSRNGARLYVGYSNGGIGVIDLATRTIEATIPVSGNINGLAIDSTGTRLYASGMFSGEVHQIDLTTLSLIRTYTIGGVTQDLALGPKGNRLLIANEGGFITDLQLGSGNMVHASTSGGAFGMVSRPLFDKAIMTIPYAAGQQNYVMAGRLIKPMFAVGGEPRRVAVHGPSGTVVLSNVQGWVEFLR